MNDKKNRAYIGKRSHGCYRIRAPFISRNLPLRLPIKGCGYGYGLRVV